MLQCRPPLDGFLDETLQGMECSLTSWGTVVPDKGWNRQYSYGVGCLLASPQADFG